MQPLKWIASLLKNAGRRRREAAVRRESARVLLKRVEEVVSATEPKIRLVRGYERRLMPAVENALDYCRLIAERIPGPFDIRTDLWGDDPQVTAYFATTDEVRGALATSPELRRFFTEGSRAEAYVLMTMAPEEKRIFGTGITGEVLQRDVQHLSVNFSRHRFTSVHPTVEEVQTDLRRRAFHFLLTCALELIVSLTREEKRLDREQEILEVQWRLRQSRERGLDAPSAGRGGKAREAGLRILSEVSDRLQQVRSRLDEPSDYLEHVAGVLQEPERFLEAEYTSPRLDKMGMKVKETDSASGHLIPYAKVAMATQGRALAAVIGRVVRDDVMEPETVS